MTFAPISLLRRLLTPKPHGPLDPAEREGRRVCETAEPCSDFDEQFSANPTGRAFVNRAQGRGPSGINPFRKSGEAND